MTGEGTGRRGDGQRATLHNPGEANAEALSSCSRILPFPAVQYRDIKGQMLTPPLPTHTWVPASARAGWAEALCEAGAVQLLRGGSWFSLALLVP